eukprot:3609830-Amphidinium_carterae.1
MEAFFSTWRWIEGGLRDSVSSEIKASLLWSQIREYAPLQAELIPYKLSGPGEACHTYEYLLKVIGRHTERTQQERCREQMIAGIQVLGGGQTKAYAASSSDKVLDEGENAGLAAKVCWSWQKGDCKRGAKCRFAHPANEKGERAKGQSNTSSGRRQRSGSDGKRSQSTSPSGSAESGLGNKCLSFLKSGQCKYGKNCRYSHDTPPASAYMSGMHGDSTSDHYKHFYTCKARESVVLPQCGGIDKPQGDISESSTERVHGNVCIRVSSSKDEKAVDNIEESTQRVVGA